jgi:hypothetical protein
MTDGSITLAQVVAHTSNHDQRPVIVRARKPKRPPLMSGSAVGS